MREQWSIFELLNFVDFIEKRMCFGFYELSENDKERLEEIRDIIRKHEGGDKRMSFIYNLTWTQMTDIFFFLGKWICFGLLFDTLVILYKLTYVAYWEVIKWAK